MRTDDEVLKHLRDRKKGGAGDRKIGLLLPGGGMSGAFTGGVVCALDQSGFSKCFDTIYAYSSGAPTAAYLMAGDTVRGSSIYKQDITGFRFFQPWKPYRWMNMEYFEHVLRHIKPLNVESIRSSATLMKIQVTDVDRGESHVFTNRGSVDIIRLMCASCVVPGFTSPIDIHGQRYCDGGIIDFLSIETMIDDGCTDILVVVNVPEGYQRPRVDIPHLLSRLFLGGYPKTFRQKYRHMVRNYNAYFTKLFSDSHSRDANIYIIAPKRFMSPMTIRGKTLRRYERDGIDLTSELLKD